MVGSKLHKPLSNSFFLTSIQTIRKRQVKDVDFGFSFPAAPEAPPQTEPSIQRTPQPELNQQLTARATPASRGRGRPSKAALAEQALNKGPAHTVSNANMSAKRRKLDSDEAPSSSRSTRSSLRAPRADIYALPGDEESLAFAADTVADTISETVERDAEAVPINSASQALSTPRSKIAQASALPTATEEVAESPAENPGSGHRLRIGLNAATAQSSQLQNALQFASPTTAASAAIQTPSQRNKRKRGSATPSGAILSAKRGRQSPRDEESLVVDDLDAPSTVQSRSSTRKSPRLHDSNNEVSSVASTSRDRSSIGAQEIEGRSSLKPTLRSGTSNQHYITNVSQEANISDYSIDLAEEISDHEAAVILKKSRGRRVSRNLPTLESPDLDENTEATPPVRRDGGAKSRKVSTPAQQRHPKPAVSKANRKASSGTVKKPSKSSRARAKNPIHITVHRLNNKPIYEGNERDVDIINLDVPNAKRAGVNAIDVLSHLCQEIINSGLSTLEVGREESQEPSLKREYTTKWRALEAFKSALQTQLLEHVSDTLKI